MLLKGQAKGGGLNNHPKGHKTKKSEATANLKMESFKTTCKGKNKRATPLFGILITELCTQNGVVIDPSQKERNAPGDVFGDEDAIRQVEDDAHNEEQTTWEQAPTGSGSDRDVLLGLQVQMNEFGARMDRLKDNQLEILRLLRQGRGAGPSSSTE
ncbi:unnamed protein product [Ilex paraguariensis]|uniref:Uncharacterized protein n=1 Tax=Ilex paraguariensis TaxID=185542 RepID=A0ABC8V416_9AQUA